MIETIEQFVEFVSTHNPTEISKFGKVTAKQNPKYPNLWLFTYTAEAAFQKQWNFVELVSRGLIVDVLSKKVIARPFDKFFNFGENDYKRVDEVPSFGYYVFEEKHELLNLRLDWK